MNDLCDVDDEIDEEPGMTKDELIDKYRDINVHDEWWEWTYERAIETARCLGIEISTSTRQGTKGRTYQDVDIQFSGFCSQGDGCSFSGWLGPRYMQGAVAKMKAHAPEDKDLHEMAAEAERLHGEVVVAEVTARMNGEEFEYPNDLRIRAHSQHYTTSIEDIDYCVEHLEDAFNSLVDDFAQWIYRQLEAEYDYMTSDEVVWETLQANEITE